MKAHQNHQPVQVVVIVVVEDALEVVGQDVQVAVQAAAVQDALESVKDHAPQIAQEVVIEEIVLVDVVKVAALVVLANVVVHRVQEFVRILVIEDFVMEVVLELVK